MYDIEEKKGQYTTFTLSDTSGKSCFTINPERGGIVTDFEVDGIGSILYMNEAIYRDPAKYIRGGIPVLFPMTGRLTGDVYRLHDTLYSMPVHGLVRNYPWEVRGTQRKDGAAITIGLRSDETMKQAFPFDFDVEFTYLLKGNTLTVCQAYTNLSGEDMPVSFGLHPYFHVKDKKNARIMLDFASYQDMVSGKLIAGAGIPDFTEGSEVGCLFLDVGGQKAALEADGYRVELAFDGVYRHVLLWTLAGEDFICMEPWTAKPDALNTGEELIRIRPGETMRTAVSITVKTAQSEV